MLLDKSMSKWKEKKKEGPNFQWQWNDTKWWFIIQSGFIARREEMFAEDSIFENRCVVLRRQLSDLIKVDYNFWKNTFFLNCVATMALSLSFKYFLSSLLHAKVICLTFCFWEMPFSSTNWARWPQPDQQVSWEPGCQLLGLFGLIFRSYTFIGSYFDRNNIHVICHL